jgi:site-specific recombinase XerD
MGENNFEMVEECFREARITDELRPASIKKYTSSICNVLQLLGPKHLTSLNNRDFDRYILEMKGRGASNAHIANVISAMKWLVARLKEKSVAFPDLNLLAIRKPKAVKKETNYLTEYEIAQFLDTVRGYILKRQDVKSLRFMALVILLLQTGARIGEALSINQADIDQENKEIPIIGKGGKPRTLFLRDETMQWIDRYLAVRKDNEPALFASLDGTARWKQTDVGRSFRRYKDLSGIKKHFVIHTFRHTFATQYLMKGAGINVVQTALGHSDPVTTLKYYAAAVEKAKVKEMINDQHFDFIPGLLSQRGYGRVDRTA